MRPISVAFAAALMLGGMSTAYAQDGPGNDRERPAQAQEQQGQSGGADRSEAETKSERRGGAEKSESRADRSDGESRSGDNRAAERGRGNETQGERRNRDAEGQGSPRQAQDEKGSPANNERASRRDDADQSSRKGQAESGKAERGDDRKAADRSDQDKEKRAQSRDDADKRTGTQKDDDAKRAESRDRQDRDDDAKRAESRDRQDRDDSAKRAERKDGDRDRKAARVDLQGEKKDKVRSAFSERSGNVKERTNVDIDISVGRALPRDWDYYPLPAAVIAIVPEYRGYDYVYVEDRYVIVEPATREVVIVIDASGNRTHASTAGRSGCPSNLELTSSDREYLLKSVQMRNEVDVSGVSIGWRVPDSVELEVFPDTVTRRISGLGSCRYFIVDDRIAIVDPEEHNVVVLVQD